MVTEGFWRRWFRLWGWGFLVYTVIGALSITQNAVTATNIARRFRLKEMGDIAPGFDLDLWIVDLSHEDVVRRERLMYRNQFSAHEGQKIRGKTINTIIRGARPGSGQLIRPAAGS